MIKTIKDLLENYNYKYNLFPIYSKNMTRISVYNDKHDKQFVYYKEGIVDVNDSWTMNDLFNHKVEIEENK